MRTTRVVGCSIALAVAAAGCALAPRQNARIDEAMREHALLLSDPRVSALAPAQAQLAHEALERAVLTWQSREDPALVDHLAYVARQRARIAIEAARRVAAEGDLARPDRETSAGAP